MEQIIPKILFRLFATVYLLFSAGLQAADTETTLRLYNWEDYMPREVLDQFVAETGVRIEEVYYETDELKEELILQTGGRGLDLIIGSSISFMAYLRQGDLLVKLEKTRLPNLTHLDPVWAERFPELAEYAVPFLWGTLGIAYRSDLVAADVTSWAQLLNPDPAVSGKILMINDKRDLFTPALKLAGYSSNSVDRKEVLEAGKYLEAQRPHVKSYQYLDLSGESELVKGDVWMAMAYNGDALLLNEINEHIKFVVPKEGTNIWIDYIAVLKASEHKEAAFDFINFINQPKIAAKLARELYYASPNDAAEALLPPEFLNDPLIYPPRDVFDKSEMTLPLKGRAMSYYNNVYNNLLIQ